MAHRNANANVYGDDAKNQYSYQSCQQKQSRNGVQRTLTSIQHNGRKRKEKKKKNIDRIHRHVAPIQD